MATISSPRSESPAISIPRITSPSIPSTSGTPVSSVRPSFEVTRNNSASPSLQHASPIANPAQRRNRAALRDYYNLKGRGPSGADYDLSRKASIASNTSESTITSPTVVPESSTLTAQLDDPYFDAEAYVSDLLKTATLQDILKAESALVSEVRNLDGERKALVYDNYSKLIKAVGTVAKMQKGMHKREPNRFSALGMQKDTTPSLEGVEKLGEKLDGLLKIVKDLGPVQREDTQRLVEAREQRRQKETVKWALDAPNRLQAMIERGQKAEAAKEYDSIKALLDQWNGVGGVDELRAECARVIDRIETDARVSEQQDNDAANAD